MERDILALKERFGLRAAVETGTCYGSSALWFAEHFNDGVESIEINPEFAAIAQRRLEQLPETHNRVYFNVIVGDSAVEMARIANLEDETTFFFLDAHFEKHCPLLDELKAIAQAGIKPVIAIHDFQVPGRPELGFDTWNNQPFRFSWIRPSLEAIYGVNGYGHHFNSDATGAKRGVIYIYPLQ